MKITSFKNITIIGLGLIGASLSQRIIKKLPLSKVIGVDKDLDTLKIAQKKKLFILLLPIFLLL